MTLAPDPKPLAPMSAKEIEALWAAFAARLREHFGIECRCLLGSADLHKRLFVEAARSLPLAANAEADARTLAIKILEGHAAHIKENVQALHKYPDTEQEARARELAGMFLTDCAISLKMDKRLADVNEFLKRIAESDAAMKEPR